MPLLKPPRGTQLNRTHPLTRNLNVCWLFNEGAGAKVFDLSGNGWTGTLQGAPSWVAGRFGSVLHYDGDNDSVETSSPVISSAPISVSLWFKVDELPSTRAEDGTLIIQRTIGSPYQSFRTLINDADNRILMLIYDSTGVNTISISSEPAIQAGIWYHVVFILDSNYNAYMYVNGVQQTGTGNLGSFYNANDVLRLGSRTGTADDFKGQIDLVTIFNRALLASEITLLYCEPFCMFDRPKSPEWIFATPTALSLAGSISAQSAASATLESLLSSPEMERDWLRGALFNGMTPNAFKLGTTLSLGWFWLRTFGCSALCRGPSMEQIDFANILTVAQQDAEIVSPATYVPHDSSSMYFYVVRRFNCCGYQERTLAVAIKVSTNKDGELLEPQPNKVFALRAKQAGSNRILLSWFYCPLEQESPPVCFNVYYDNRTGQIDYQVPLASISYRGRKFYRYHTYTLAAGRYLFAVSVEDANGMESSSSAQLTVQVNAASPDPIEILCADCL